MRNKDTINISIGWVFDETDQETRNQRVLMAKKTLDENGCRITRMTDTMKGAQTTTEILAICPVGVRGIHHGFDSKLNKSYPKGCGAGWVSEK